MQALLTKMGLAPLIAGLVLAAFVGFAFFAPQTFEATGAARVGAQEIEVRVRSVEPARARAASEELVRRAVRWGSVPPALKSGLVDHPVAVAATLIAEHPVPTPSTIAPSKPRVDRTRLELERSAIQAKLERIARATQQEAEDADDIFDDRQIDAAQLTRRLAEIHARLQEADQSVGTVRISAETGLESKLAEPLAAVADLAATDGEPDVRPRSVVTAVEPNRGLLLILGTALAAIAAALSGSSRRPRSSESELTDAGSATTPAPTPASAQAGPIAQPPQSGLLAFPIADYLPPAVPRARYMPIMEHVRPLCRTDCFVLGVSGSSGAGSAFAAVELALALSDDDDFRVLLLEGNLIQPRLHEVLKIQPPPSTDLVSQLQARVRGDGGQRWCVGSCGAGLHVLLSKVAAPELLLSRYFEEAVVTLRPFYDCIVLHGPSVTELVACRAVDDVIDGIILISPDGGHADPSTVPFTAKRYSTVLSEA